MSVPSYCANDAPRLACECVRCRGVRCHAVGTFQGLLTLGRYNSPNSFNHCLHLVQICLSRQTLPSISSFPRSWSHSTSKMNYRPSSTCVYLIFLPSPPSPIALLVPFVFTPDWFGGEPPRLFFFFCLLQMRPLASTDYERGHLSVLSVLTQAPDVGAEAWAAQFHVMRAEPATYYILVVVSRETDQIVGVGGVFLERKFLRGLGRVGHIEDIAVTREMQGKKLGLRIILALTHISETVGCYKTILNCTDANARASLSASVLPATCLANTYSFLFLSILRKVWL